MLRTKSTSKHPSKPLSITSQFKFQKIQKLAHLIHQVAEHTQSKDVGDRVLDVLKTHIRTNYDNLYHNYGDNKKKILKQIQAVETNIAGENAMNHKFDELVKDKSKYDKLHAEVVNKQRVLKKLQEVSKQLTDEQVSMKLGLGVETTSKEAMLLEERGQLENQFLILQEMLASRQSVQLSHHQKILRFKEELTAKQEKISRLVRENQKKQETMKKLATQLQKENEIEIPLKLAEELSLKVEMYENKYSYSNIIEHQAILGEQRLSKLKDTIRSQKQHKKLQKLQRQDEQKAQIDQLYNMALIKNYEQQKIKKYCRVQSIQDAFNFNSLFNGVSMEELSKEIENNIIAIEQENKKLSKSIQSQMGIEKQSELSGNSYQYQSLLTAAEKQKNHFRQEALKWESKANQWLTILALLQIDPTPEGFSKFKAMNTHSDTKPVLEESRTNTENRTSSKSDLR